MQVWRNGPVRIRTGPCRFHLPAAFWRGRARAALVRVRGTAVPGMRSNGGLCRGGWMRRTIRAGALLAAVALAAGCAAYGGGSAGASNGRATATALEGTTWSLVELGGQPARPAGDNGTPTLHLAAAQKRASGNTGCNSFGGGYELSGASLRFGALASTRRACVDEALNRQEAAFLRALADTRTLRIANGMLVLRGEAGGGAGLS